MIPVKVRLRLAESFFQEHTPDPEWLIRWASSESAPLIGPNLFPVYQWEEMIYWVQNPESPPASRWEGNWVRLECKKEALQAFWQKFYADIFTPKAEALSSLPPLSSPTEEVEGDLKLETRLYRTVVMETLPREVAKDLPSQSSDFLATSSPESPKQSFETSPKSSAVHPSDAKGPLGDHADPESLLLDETPREDEADPNKDKSSPWEIPEGLEGLEGLSTTSEPQASNPTEDDLLPEGLELAGLASNNPASPTDTTPSLSDSSPAITVSSQAPSPDLLFELPPRYEGWGTMEWKEGYYYLTYSSEASWQPIHLSASDPSPIRVMSKTHKPYHGSLYPNGVLKIWFEDGLGMRGIPRCLTAVPIKIEQGHITKILFAWSDQDVRSLKHLEQFTQAVAKAIGDNSVLFDLNSLPNQLANAS
jgi:hypothetical protein